MDWYTATDTSLETSTDATLSALLDGTPTTVDTSSLTWFVSTDFQAGLLTDAQASALGDGRAPLYTPWHGTIVVSGTSLSDGTRAMSDGWNGYNKRFHVY